MKKIIFNAALTSIALFALLGLTTCGNNIDTTTTAAERFPIMETGIYTDEIFDEGEEITVHMSGDVSIYRSIDELIEFTRVTDIVRVEVLAERAELLDLLFPPRDSQTLYVVNTIHQLKVLEVFHGDASEGEIIELAQMGGQLGRVSLLGSYFTEINIGQDLVLFLSRISPELMEKYGYRPAIMHPFQAAFHIPIELAYPQTIVDASRLRTMSNDVVLRGLHPNNDLILTVGDLANIAEGIMPQPISYLLSFDLEHGTDLDGIESIYVPRGANIFEYLTNNHESFPSQGPTREGYVFMGWHFEGHVSLPVTEEHRMPPRDATIHARWERGNFSSLDDY